MKLFKEIFENIGMFFTGLGVSVILPFFTVFLQGRKLNDLLPEFILVSIIYTFVFIWIMKGGLSSIKDKK